jgi:hypothetical protein
LNVTGIEARLDRLIAAVEEQSVQIADLRARLDGPLRLEQPVVIKQQQ